MVMDNPFDSTDIAYDLRFFYAQIVGNHLRDIYTARKEGNYPLQLEQLEDLYTVVRPRFEKKAEEWDKEFWKLHDDAVKIFIKEKSTFTGVEKKPLAVKFIREILRKIEMKLYAGMHTNNMFGSTKKLEGL